MARKKAGGKKANAKAAVRKLAKKNKKSKGPIHGRMGRPKDI